MVTGWEALDWGHGLEVLCDRLSSRFGRIEVRRRALSYLRGLLSDVDRKNGWQLAEASGDRTPSGVQEFLSRTHWDADLVRDDLRAYVVERLGAEDGVLVLDETGFLKKGTHSVGVQRQYSGTAGRIENCQIGVFLGYASRYGQALIDRALYLPQSWAKDAERRAKAGVPEEVVFATKPKLGKTMLAQAFAAGVPCAFVTGDSVYGGDYDLRRFIEENERGYVMAVTSGQNLGLRRVDEWVDDVPKTAWARLSAGEGAKGPRLYDWAYLPFNGAKEGWRKGLLIRRKIAKPDDLTFYLTLAPETTDLAALVRVAGMRWTIEACFEAAKGEVGLDQYEVRSWTGWRRHITLAMLAHAYLAVVRAAIGGTQRPRFEPRPSPSHRPRNPASSLKAPLGQNSKTRRRHRLVPLETTTSTTSQASSLEKTNSI